MKFKSYLAMAACGMMFAACQNPGAGQSSDAADASKADSLIYYFARLRGAEYDREAQRDTTLATDEAKKAYLMGVQAGLNAAKADNDPYNRGLFLGMQMAMNFDQFKKDYDITLNRNVFIKGLTETIKSDSIGNPGEMQREFYRLMGEFNTRKEEKDNLAAAESLRKAGSDLKLKKISDNLYGEVTTKTDSVRIKDGDNVDAKITLAHTDGKSIDAPIPSKLKVGTRSLPEPVSEALKTMKSGETGKFVTTAKALFGQRVSQLGLEAADAIVIDIKVTATAPEAPANEPKK